VQISLTFTSLNISLTIRYMDNAYSSENKPEETLVAGSYVEPELPVVTPVEVPVISSHESSGDIDFDEWKREIENDFSHWINGLTAVPQTDLLDDAPDIYSFYEELSLLSNEMRKGNRKSSESFSRFDINITEFVKLVTELRGEVKQLASNQTVVGASDYRKLLVTLVEIAERLNRMERAVDTPPDVGFFSGTSKWKQTFGNIKKGFTIIVSHVESLLAKEGVERIKTTGNIFDPTKMVAVAAEKRNDITPNTVIEEISPGYIYDENVLKLAEVKVAIQEKGA